VKRSEEIKNAQDDLKISESYSLYVARFLLHDAMKNEFQGCIQNMWEGAKNAKKLRLQRMIILTVQTTNLTSFMNHTFYEFVESNQK
jgi:hypothetical protein